MRHKMTFSHFSKGFIRPNLGEESGCGLLPGFTFPFSVSRFPFSHFRLSYPLRPKPLGTGLVTHSSGSKYNRHAAAVALLCAHGGCTPVVFDCAAVC